MLAGLASIGGFVQGGVGGGLSATVSEEAVSKTGSTYNTDKVLTTAPVTVTVVGGSGSYAHDWSSVDAVNSSATAPTSSSTAFTALMEPGAAEHAHWIDTVTDTLSGAQVVVEVAVTLNLVSYL